MNTWATPDSHPQLEMGEQKEEKDPDTLTTLTPVGNLSGTGQRPSETRGVGVEGRDGCPVHVRETMETTQESLLSTGP